MNLFLISKFVGADFVPLIQRSKRVTRELFLAADFQGVKARSSVSRSLVSHRAIKDGFI
jgi:hypothetical protein